MTLASITAQLTDAIAQHGVLPCSRHVEEVMHSRVAAAARRYVNAT